MSEKDLCSKQATAVSGTMESNSNPRRHLSSYTGPANTPTSNRGVDQHEFVEVNAVKSLYPEANHHLAYSIEETGMTKPSKRVCICYRKHTLPAKSCMVIT